MGATSINTRILKLTTLFGGIQGATILCSIVRLKLVAVWMGTAGIGLFGLLNSVLETIFTFSQLGLRQSAVRDIAGSTETNIPQTVRAVRRWGLWLGITGAILTMAASPWLSILSFGDKSHWWMFAALSVTVLFSAISNAEGAVFQGLQRFRKLAACSLAGTIGGLVISVPMFYIWRIDSIVPSFIAYFTCTFIALGLYRERVPDPAPQSLSDTLSIGRKFMKLGLYMTVTALTANLVSALFMAYINRDDGLDITGCYNAGFTLVNRYAGLVFAAISMEYFPRIAKVAASRRRTSMFVSNQLYIALTLIVPLATMLIAGSGIIIRLLYSSEFIIITPFVIWGSVGTVFRAVGWCFSFVILARNDGRTFLVTEIASGVISLVLNMIGYRIGGFTGLGYAYIGWYLIYSLMVGIVYIRHYKLQLHKNFPLYLAGGLAATIITAVIATVFTQLWALPPAIAVCIVAALILKKLISRKRGTITA